LVRLRRVGLRRRKLSRTRGSDCGGGPLRRTALRCESDFRDVRTPGSRTRHGDVGLRPYVGPFGGPLLAVRNGRRRLRDRRLGGRFLLATPRLRRRLRADLRHRFRRVANDGRAGRGGLGGGGIRRFQILRSGFPGGGGRFRRGDLRPGRLRRPRDLPLERRLSGRLRRGRRLRRSLRDVDRWALRRRRRLLNLARSRCGGGGLAFRRCGGGLHVSCRWPGRFRRGRGLLDKRADFDFRWLHLAAQP
jgi:hypothetical protein